MIALAWYSSMLLSMLLASSQAFITAPVPGYPHGLSTRGGAPSQTTTTSTESRRGEDKVLPLGERLVAEERGVLEDDDDDDEALDSEDDYGMVGPVPPPAPGRRSDEQTVYVIEFETEADGKGESHRNHVGKDMSDDGSDGQSPLDPWSIVWYIGSFGGLVAFFLIVSCSEWCCRRGARPLSVPYTQRGEVINAAGQPASDSSPPPPYHLFAPPPYDSVNYAEIADKGPSGEKLDIYVITLPIQQPQVPQPSLARPLPQPPA